MTFFLALTLAAFNLACSGTSTIIGANKPASPFQETYRVDLSASRFCMGKCTETEALAEVSATEIVLFRHNLPEVPLDWFAKVSRESGGYTEAMKSSFGTTVKIGKCEVRPFGGFPTRIF